MIPNPIEDLAASFWSAVLRDLPNGQDGKRPRAHQCEVYAMFPQVWGDTSLGFGGVGGQAFTTAYTTIVSDGGGSFAVYFGGRLAYVLAVQDLNESAFHKDIELREMAEVSKRSKYRRAAASIPS